MEIKFRTKEEANKEQLKTFFSLSGIERINAFLNLARTINRFHTKAEQKNNNNFIVK